MYIYIYIIYIYNIYIYIYLVTEFLKSLLTWNEIGINWFIYYNSWHH